MRERVFQDSEQSATLPRYFEYTDTNTITSSSPLSYIALLRYNAMTDVVIPNFKSRSLNGEVFINDLYKQDLIKSHQPFTYESEGIHGVTHRPFKQVGAITADHFHTVYDEQLTVSNWDDEFLSSEELRELAIAQSWANVNVSEIQALASLGEMPETIAWIAAIFRRALNLVRLFKGKMVKRAIKRALSKGNVVDTVSDMWLEFRYAFRPLVFEMRQAVAALSAQAKRGSRQTARGWQDHSEKSYVTEREIQSWYVAYDVTRSKTCTYKIRAGVLYDIDSDIDNIMSIWGFDQPFETVWELTPFSFILDWFFNIGDVLSSWTGQTGLSPLGSWVTQHTSITETITVSNLEYDFTAIASGTTGEVVLQQPGVSKVQALYKRRIPNPSRAILPSSSINLDVAKLVDLAAIGRALLRAF